jgi:hypothetical protein
MSSPTSDRLYSPFSLKINPMQRLFLINFEKDPDEIYIGFEPQWFDDKSYGKGLRVIAWRKDGFVDVYQQPSLAVETNFAVAGKGLSDLLERPMLESRFNISQRGVDVSFSFLDKLGRSIEVEICEKSLKPTEPFTILAPVGSGSENPSSLPVFFLQQFYFVRRARTKVKISISGRLHQPDTFPFPFGGSRVYYMRYSGDAFLVDWCSEYSGPLPEIQQSVAGKATYEFEGNGLKSMKAGDERHEVVVQFVPPFPEVTTLEDQTSLQGRFDITAHESAGSVSGTYHVMRSGDKVVVKVHPSGGWQPKPATLFLKFLFRVAKVFRHWPKTYQWTATIELRGQETPHVDSRWVRV